MRARSGAEWPSHSTCTSCEYALVAISWAQEFRVAQECIFEVHGSEGRFDIEVDYYENGAFDRGDRENVWVALFLLYLLP